MKAIIIGATSGIGLEVARKLHKDGWTLGLAGRREELLLAVKQELDTSLSFDTSSESLNTAPESLSTTPDSLTTSPDSVHEGKSHPQTVYIRRIDVCEEDASRQLLALIDQMDGTDLIFIASGYGMQNPLLEEQIEIAAARTNVEGFMRMTTTAFKYFQSRGHGHIAAITSIAATKGLGSAPAYSSTKRFQSQYLQSLAQLSHMKKANIRFTEIRPGFVDTAFLKADTYPMLLRPEKVASRIVQALKTHRRTIIIDWRYSIIVFLWRLIPNTLWECLEIKSKNC